jgi:hypothetical protein
MIPFIALTVFSVQLETEYAKMSSAPDDFWYENALPHHTGFDTVAYGAGLRYDVQRLQLTVGWRSLGNQHQASQIIADATYFACRSKPSTCPPASSYWTETGSESQTYIEAGYALHLGSWRLVPSVGFAETRIASHVDFYSFPALKPYNEPCSAGPQTLPKPFFGLTLQRGPFGVGVDLLNTEPNRGANSCASPIQGSSATYLRLTYAFGVK